MGLQFPRVWELQLVSRVRWEREALGSVEVNGYAWSVYLHLTPFRALMGHRLTRSFISLTMLSHTGQSVNRLRPFSCNTLYQKVKITDLMILQTLQEHHIWVAR